MSDDKKRDAALDEAEEPKALTPSQDEDDRDDSDSEDHDDDSEDTSPAEDSDDADDDSEDEDSEDDDSEDEDEDEDDDHEDEDDKAHTPVAAHHHDHHTPPPHKPAAITAQGEGPVSGLLAFFDHPDDILHAAEKVRDQRFDAWDVLTPFPIHGMDDAMGIGRSWMPWVTLMLAGAGLTTALTLQFGTMTFDWPIIISGKPFAAWPSFMPISFELTVLFAGVGTAIIMLLTAGLPKLKPRILDPRLSSDRFAIWISAEDERFDLAKTRAFLETLHPLEVRELRGDA